MTPDLFTVVLPRPETLPSISTTAGAVYGYWTPWSPPALFSAHQCADFLGVSIGAARRALRQLEKHGLIAAWNAPIRAHQPRITRMLT